MDNVAGLLLLVVSVISVDAFLTILVLFLPGPTERARTAVVTMPGRVFALGFVNALFFGTIAFVLAAIGGQLPSALNSLFVLAALSITIVLVALSLLGVAAQVALLRDRLGADPLGMGGLLRAGGLLLLGTAAPIVGWFILAPIVLLVGLGAAILALAGRLRRQTPANGVSE